MLSQQLDGKNIKASEPVGCAHTNNTPIKLLLIN